MTYVNNFLNKTGEEGKFFLFFFLSVKAEVLVTQSIRLFGTPWAAQALARLHPFRAHFTETGALWPLVGYAGSQTG